ncbi:MAG: EAL domain-containing protein [Bradyrhizobiaceae bacterium]|nr:MAG: EAL domain-containing protein [Bradyrhizobiaceae bacterium]
MNDTVQEDASARPTFGKRKIKPRLCIVENKQHILTLLGDTLEDQGFIPTPCSRLDDLGGILETVLPDVVIVPTSVNGLPTHDIIHALAAGRFPGKVLLIGPSVAPAVAAARELCGKLGLDLLPVLATPFREEDLFNSVASLVPAQAPPPPPVDVTEALDAGWLELWYQPKIDIRTMALGGAEALIRMRHPTWGIVPPAYFIPDGSDPHFRDLSRFVIGRVFEDWRYLATHLGRIHLSINLPISFFREPGAIGDLRAQFPDHPAFDGLTVEVASSEVTGNLALATEAARQMRFHHIGFSIDNVGEEWPLLVGLSEFPFAEIKLDREFVDGSSSEPLKRSVCRHIADLANDYGARTVAEGVETKEDFRAMHDIGVDAIQGFLFGRPMAARKFARDMRGGLVFKV